MSILCLGEDVLFPDELDPARSECLLHLMSTPYVGLFVDDL